MFDFLTKSSQVPINAMKASTHSPVKIEPFPEAQIRESITAWWNEEVEKRQKDPFAPKDRKDTLYEVLPVIDSLAVLESMIIIEQLLDHKIPAKFIRKGGYDSSDEMLKHLLPQLQKLHNEKYGR